MDLCQIDDEGRLFISRALEDWAELEAQPIDVVIDLEGGLDGCIPTAPERCVYIYCPIYDDNEQMPGMAKLWAIARLAASLMREGHTVLSHCSLGYNRSAFLAGLILVELGMTGREAADRIRARRPGALFNPLFAEYLESCVCNSIQAGS